MSQVHDSCNDLRVEWRRFQESWRGARELWKDEVAADFERRFVRQLEDEIPAFLRALESLGDELQAARRELR